MVVFRPMEERDIPFALESATREGWHSSAASFRVHLMHDSDGCFIASYGERPVALMTSTCFPRTGWVGNLIVDPEMRRQGLGTRFMKYALGHLAARGCATVRLEADPLGEGIYRRLGFVNEFESPRFRREAGGDRPDVDPVPLLEADIPELRSFDAPYFGEDRGELLRFFLPEVRATYRVPRRGGLAGYLMAQPSLQGLRLGPWVAREPQAAAELLHMVLADFPDEDLVVALPGPNRAGCALLQESGFAATPSSLRMRRGEPIAAGQPATIYGLASGACG
jgi:ribosomal protein S18 acetylase RimI-like enzyme